MTIPESLSLAHSENLISLLCNSNEHGKLIATLIDVNLFEGDYRIIADRAVRYWKEHNSAPGIHTVDLFADILEDPRNRKATTFRRIINQMAQLHDAGINAQYVLQHLRRFHRMQQMKVAVMRAAEHLEQSSIEMAEQELGEIIRARDNTAFDPGTRLYEIDKLLHYLETHYNEFPTGIPQLDAHNITPQRSTVLTFLAPTGFGKTWLLIHLGKRAVMHHKRVLHISLEMGEEEVMLRYMQSLFAVPKRTARDKIESTVIELDNGDRVSGFSKETIKVDFAFDSMLLRDELQTRIETYGYRYQNLLIKRFPPRFLTPDGLRGFLDALQSTSGFVPDLILLDYIGLMDTDVRNPRITLGRNMEELRAIAVERNVACATAQQVSRMGVNSRHVAQTHVAEDFSIIHTSDIVITYSSTPTERKYGLARLYVSKARTEGDKFGVLITQNYTIGQFVLSSLPLNSDYWDALDALENKEKEKKDSDDEDPED